MAQTGVRAGLICCMERAKAGRLHCLTTNIICRDGSCIDKLFYMVNDAFQYASYLHRPFRRVFTSRFYSPRITGSANSCNADGSGSCAAECTRRTAGSNAWDICGWDGYF